MTTNLRDLNLKPRAVAVLVSLRRGPLTARAIADAIADHTVAETGDRLRLMADGIDGDHRGHKLVQLTGARSYGLTHDGLGWLQAQGLDASESAKQALYAAAGAERVNPHCGVRGCPGGQHHAHDPADWSTDAQAVRP